MRTIIAGTRYFDDAPLMDTVLSGCVPWPITEVVSGACNGADRLAENWAKMNGIPLVRFPADWKRLGKPAGPMRNRMMANYAEALVAFWDGESRGTGHMIHVAKEKGLKVLIHRYKARSVCARQPQP